jgi:hypothetical protein
MMKRKLFLVWAGLTMCAGMPVSAHHSHASTYFEDKREEIDGEILQVSIRNPHSWVHVNVKQPNGEVIVYAIEWAAGTQLNRVGINGKTLKPGDKVHVMGAPGRNPADHRLEMQNIVRAGDGWKWGFLPGEVVN